MQITSVESNFANLSYSYHVLQALFGFLNIVFFDVIIRLYFSAIKFKASKSAGAPPIWTGIIAFVLSVIFSSTDFGSILDPYIDSISRLIVFWALGFTGLASKFVILIMALRDVSVCYIRMILIKNKKSAASRWSGKVKAAVQGIGAMLLLLGPVYYDYVGGKWILELWSWTIIIVTLYSLLDYSTSVKKQLMNLEY